jgi:hypothetical protein
MSSPRVRTSMTPSAYPAPAAVRKAAAASATCSMN